MTAAARNWTAFQNAHPAEAARILAGKDRDDRMTLAYSLICNTRRYRRGAINEALHLARTR